VYDVTWSINDLKFYRKQPTYGTVGGKSVPAVLPTYVSFTLAAVVARTCYILIIP